MKKLKVIQIIDSLNVGGAEVLAVNIANGLSELDIDSHICVTRKEGDLKENINPKVGYLFLERTSTFDFKAIIKLKNYIKKHQINVVHAHATSSFIAYIIKLLLPRITFVWHNHSGAYIRLKGKKLYVLKFISKKINKIITVNKQLAEWSKNVLKHTAVFYVSNFPNFSNQKEITSLKGEKDKRIVHLAGFRSEKDHINLLQSFIIVKEKYPDWTLHLIGKDYQDDYSASIKKFISEHQLSESVFLYGVCADIKHILSQATIGVLSSKSEGLPISLLEYGLAKLPVLVTEVGECKNVVKNKNALVAPNRSDMFADKLMKLIENTDVRSKISNELHHRVVKEYAKEAVLQRLIKIYIS